MNPVAGTFHPTQAGAQMNSIKGLNGSKLSSIAPINPNMDDGEVTVEDLLLQFRRAVIDELCLLRVDVDALQNAARGQEKGASKTDSRAVAEFMRQQAFKDISKRWLSKTVSTEAYLQALRLSAFAEGVQQNRHNLSMHIDHDTNRAHTLSDESWKPAYLHYIRPLKNIVYPPADRMVTFSWDTLQKMFKGEEHTPGLFYTPKAAGDSVLPHRTFYAMDSTNEPYLPDAPGEHGAKITAFFNGDDPKDGTQIAFENIPLFVSASKWGGEIRKSNEYIYIGSYSQTRWSDKIGYDILQTKVPEHVKKYWAAQLADPARPRWVFKALMKHFFPPPEYTGHLPKTTGGTTDTGVIEEDRAVAKKMQRNVKDHIHELTLWQAEAELGVNLMKQEDILKAFDNPDADETPGLRLWWEYLECQAWDADFYDMLVNEQNRTRR